MSLEIRNDAGSYAGIYVDDVKVGYMDIDANNMDVIMLEMGGWYADLS